MCLLLTVVRHVFITHCGKACVYYSLCLAMCLLVIVVWAWLSWIYYSLWFRCGYPRFMAPFILAIFLAFRDCSAIKWVLNPIGEFIAQQSRELKNL